MPQVLLVPLTGNSDELLEEESIDIDADVMPGFLDAIDCAVIEGGADGAPTLSSVRQLPDVRNF